MSKSRKVPSSPCPSCNTVLDHATPTQGDYSPEPGAVSCCIECGAWLMFDRRLRLCPIRADKILKLSPKELGALEFIRRQVDMRPDHKSRQNCVGERFAGIVCIEDDGGRTRFACGCRMFPKETQAGRAFVLIACPNGTLCPVSVAWIKMVEGKGKPVLILHDQNPEEN